MRFDCIEKPLSELYRKYGEFLAKHPVFFILPPVLITGALSVGIMFVKTNMDIEYLFTPENGLAKEERKVQNNWFRWRPADGAYWFGRVIITAADGQSIFRHETFLEIKALDASIKNISVVDNKTASPKGRSFYDLCLKWRGKCMENPVLDLVTHDESTSIVNISALKYPYTLMSEFVPVSNLTSPYKFYTAVVLGGVETAADDTVKSAKAMVLSYQIIDRGEDWHGNFLKHMPTLKFKHISVAWFGTDTLTKELFGTIVLVIPRLVITVFLLILFATASCMMADWVQSKPILALFGVFSALLAIASSLGLLMFCRVEFTTIVCIMPFLVIGIGVDDMFVMLAAWRQTERSLGVSERMGKTFSEAATSITITSITNVLSFGIGAITVFPSIRLFCLYTGVAILFDFIYQITFFGGWLAVFGKREELRKHAITCQKTLPKSEAKLKSKPYMWFCTGGLSKKDPRAEEDNREHRGMKFFKKYFAPFLVHIATKVLVIVLFLIYLGVAIYGCTTLKEGLKLGTLVSDNSYAVRYYSWEEQFFTKYSHKVAFMITEKVNYSSPQIQRQLIEFVESLEDTGSFYGVNMTESWLLSLLEFTKANNITIDKSNFSSMLDGFLQIPAYSHFSSDLNRTNIANSSMTMIIGSRFYVTCKDMISSNHEKSMMLSARRLAADSNISMTAFNYRFVYFDQYLVIFANTFQNVGIATACMLVVSLLMIPQPICSLWVALCIVSIEVGVIGYMSLWNVPLDAVSMTNIILCIGFCVDFSAHITYAYVIAEGNSSKEKVTDALHSLGYPITQAACSTIIAVSVLSTAEASIFRTFFKILFLVNVLGFLHGIFLLPVLLSILGPKQSIREEKKQSEGHTSRVSPEPDSTRPTQISETAE